MTATTGIDSLLDLLQEEKDIELDEAAKKLDVDKDQVQQWVDFLVENNRVMVHYKFMTPYLTLLDPRGRPDDNDSRQTLSSIRQHQKKFITAIKTRDIETAKEEYRDIKEALQKIEDPSLQRDIKREINAYPERIKKIGGEPPHIETKTKTEQASSTTDIDGLKQQFTEVKELSQAGRLAEAKNTLLKIQKEADNADLPGHQEKTIREKIETAKHHIETVKKLREKGEVS